MEIPLSLLLVFYLVYLLIYFIITFFNVYHIVKYGFVSFWAYVITLIYIGAIFITIIISFLSLRTIDWDMTFSIFQNQGLNLFPY